MAYDLGIDVGTSFTAAAVRRNQLVEVVGLGPIADNVPSVVYVDRDGRTIVGDAANRRGLTDPTAVARDFKRRLGDPTPLIVGGVPFSAESLTARVLEWVVARVTEREREPPCSIAATFPANWGPYKQELFGQALRLASLEHTTTITEPHAAALDYASRLRVPPGAVLAVYDLGGGTFDAALLRKETDRFELLAEEGVEHLGGVDFDSAIVSYVLSSAGLRWSGDASEDPSLLPALTSLRRACVEAKELLSSETEATVSVFVPGVETAVRVARSQFEGMIRDRLTETITAIRAAIARAGLTPADVSAFLLVGGSSRIPLVAQMVRAEFGRPLATDLDPMYAVARGAAIAAGQFAERTGLAEPPPARQEPARHDPGRHDPARPTMAGLPAVGRESYGMRPEAPPIGGPPPRLTPSPMTRPHGLQPQAPPLAAAPAAPPTARTPPAPAPTPAARPFDPGETVAFDRAATPPG
ncbi:MAG: Hsp70 family protein, partial [Acidimicrobiales bacterium]